MKKAMMTAMVIGVLGAPAVAQNWDPTSYAQAIAVMIGYDARCGGLPPNVKLAVNNMAELIDKREAGPAVLTVMKVMEETGITQWCANVKPVVAAMQSAVR